MSISDDVVIMTEAEFKQRIDAGFRQGVERGRLAERFDIREGKSRMVFSRRFEKAHPEIKCPQKEDC